MHCKILDLHPCTCSFTRLLLNFGKYIAVKSRATENGIACDAQNHASCHKTNSYPTEFSFPRHDNTWIGTSKCLSQGDVELSSFHSRDRVQISSNIEANRADWRLVPQADADRICVVSNKVVNANRAVDIATIVENGGAETLFVI